MSIAKSLLALGFGASVAMALPLGAQAQIVDPSVQSNIILAADGCGPGWYRGPGGACHPFGRGPFPGGYYVPGGYAPPPAYSYNGCPPGYWRGPWGHCRDTPYHGRLPNGYWQ